MESVDKKYEDFCLPSVQEMRTQLFACAKVAFHCRNWTLSQLRICQIDAEGINKNHYLRHLRVLWIVSIIVSISRFDEIRLAVSEGFFLLDPMSNIRVANILLLTKNLFSMDVPYDSY